MHEPELTFAAVPISPLIGAAIHLDKEALLRGEFSGKIRSLLEERGVLVFPKIHFSPDEHIAFTKCLGTYVSDFVDGSTTAITIDPAAGRLADYTRASFYWHFDGYMNEAPILGSILCCIQPSHSGGDTLFCNTYAAWDALPDARKAELEGLRAVHALAGAPIIVDPEPKYDVFAEWLRVPHRALPLVWTHRSGRKSLVVGNTAVNVIGMDPLQGLDLLVWLRDWATQERFCYCHEWSEGDAVLWDNTGTLHKATFYPPNSGRVMRRTKLAGEEPFA